MSKKADQKRLVILLGPPGSGKGTQAELLSERFNLYYFETSRILEEKFRTGKKGESIRVDGKDYKISDEKKNWETGKLCSPPFVTYLVARKIRELHQEGKNIILSGSPRTLYEGKKIVPILKELFGVNNIKVFFLELTPEQTIWRNTHRRICELMRHPILYSKENAKLKKCPLDGSKLLKRKGLDDPETIKVRLKEYKERTYPLIQYFTKERLLVIKINGEQSVEDVFRDILKSM